MNDCLQRVGVILRVIGIKIWQVFCSLILGGVREGNLEEEFLFPVYSVEYLNVLVRLLFGMEPELTCQEAGIWRSLCSSDRLLRSRCVV
jgi:hypothetical protein